MKVLPLKDQLNGFRAEIKRTGEKLLELRKDNEFTPPPMIGERAPDRLVGTTVTGRAETSGLADCEAGAASTIAAPRPDYGEMNANLMLAFRCLEDARMRVGKVIQALEGGESIYDRQ